MLKIISLFMLILTASCFLSGRKGQKQGLVSPSGNYVAYMPIEPSKNVDMKVPVWTPSLKDKKGKLLYRDENSDLSGYHNSYWDWNGQNTGIERFWVYNSDTGVVTVYYQEGKKWIKKIYDKKKDKIRPPGIIREKLKKSP